MSLPCQVHSTAQNTLLQPSSRKKRVRKIFILWLPSSSLLEPSSPFIFLAPAHRTSHGRGRREINSSQLVLSCNALLSGQAAVAFLARKGGLTPTLPSFRWTTSKVISLPLILPSGCVPAWINETYVHIHRHRDKQYPYTPAVSTPNG